VTAEQNALISVAGTIDGKSGWRREREREIAVLVDDR